MILIKKDIFVKELLKIIKIDLIKDLPKEGVEIEMVRKAYIIIIRKAKHLRKYIDFKCFNG